MRTPFRLGLVGALLIAGRIFAAAPVMQRSDAVAVVLGDPVQYHVIALGGVTGYAAQGLPAGVTIDAATGTINGTPAQVGTYPVAVTATNADGASTVTITVNVVAPDAGPMIYAPLQFDAYNDPHPGGGWFTCALKATGSPSSFQTSETLPPQWTFSSGTFVGPTNQPGIHVIPVSATNANGIGSAAITIRVHAACTQVQQSTGVLHAGDVFRVTLQFNRPVSFSGAAPYLEFHTATDGTARRIPYVSGNGTTTLEFAYPVTAADAAGDILLYTTIQPAAGGAAAALADQDGMMPGAALPIVGPSVAAASIAAAPVATTSTPTGGGLGAAPSPAPATPVATSSSSVASATTASTPTSTASTPASAPTSTAPAANGATTTSGATSVATTSTPAATPVATSAPSSSDVVVTASSSVTPVSSSSTATGAKDSSLVASSSTSTSSNASTSTAPQVDSSRLINLSSRALVSGGDSAHAFIAGFVVSGTTPKRMLLRAVGPGLSPFGVQGALASPQLQVFDASGHAVTAAADTSAATTSAVGASVGAFSLASGSGDAAEVVTLAPGSYSMQITSGTGSGVALAEAYDADAAQTSAPLINLSTRANVGTGEGVLAAGFVVNGSAPKRLLIRGVGPGLAAYGVSGTLADPRVTVYQGNTVVAQNDNWETAQAVDGAQTATTAEINAAASSVGAFALTSGSKDAALIVTLPAGAYSAVVTGANGAGGAALVEVYELPAK